jgi:mRNA interferase RelE/StbE
MAWRIDLSDLAKKNLRGLAPRDASRILRFLNDRVAALDDPRSLGEALKGRSLGAYWKYRVGDFRVIADIDDREIRILVVREGNRREVYRR